MVLTIRYGPSHGLKRPMTLSPLADWAPQCFAECGPIFGTYVVQRTELFSSNTADLSVEQDRRPRADMRLG